jgi:hypothetical protein
MEFSSSGIRSSLKYSEDITDNLIKYVLLDIQPIESFKEFDVSCLLIFKGVLRIVVAEDNEDNESIIHYTILSQSC